MKRLAIGFLALALVIGTVAFALRQTIALRLMERVVTNNMQSSLIDQLPDGLHVVLCGAGSPLPDVERSGPCVAVIAGKRLFIVDAGSGASRVLARSNLPQGGIEAIFLTHFHSDHIDGLGEMMLQRWAGGANAQPAPIFGPEGVERIVSGFNEAYAQDFVYRVAHHGASTVPPGGAGGIARPFPLPALSKAEILLAETDLSIRAFRVDHKPVAPAVGYRFDYKGRSVVISGDTVKSANLQNFSRNIDLLVHEALSPRLVGLINRAAESAGVANIQKITADIPDYHASPVEVAEIARDAAVKHLLYYHIVPPLPLAPLQAVFLEGTAEVYSGPITLGRDGTMIQLPANSDEIHEKELL